MNIELILYYFQIGFSSDKVQCCNYWWGPREECIHRHIDWSPLKDCPPQTQGTVCGQYVVIIRIQSYICCSVVVKPFTNLMWNVFIVHVWFSLLLYWINSKTFWVFITLCFVQSCKESIYDCYDPCIRKGIPWSWSLCQPHWE